MFLYLNELLIRNRVGSCVGRWSVHKFGFYEIGFVLFFFKFWIEEIGEKEDFEDGKHDEKFDENYCPERSSERHVLKTISVENI